MNGSPFLGATTEDCSAIQESRFTGSIYGSHSVPAFENISDLFLPEKATKKTLGLSNLTFDQSSLSLKFLLSPLIA